MRVEGTYQVPAPPERVWQILLDPAFIRQAIPGCEQLVQEGDGIYRISMRASLGPVKSSFTGQVRLDDLRPHHHYCMLTSAQGPAGFLNGSAAIDLAPKDGGTEVRYSGDVQVGGMLAAVGSRMVEAAFRKSVNDFFTAVTNQARS